MLDLRLRRRHGERRVARDHLRQLDRARDQPVRLDHLGHDAPLQRLLRIDAIGGEQQLAGAGEADQPRQQVQPRTGDDAALRLVETDVGLAGHDADVAAERRLEAAADGDAVDRGDERLGIRAVGVRHDLAVEGRARGALASGDALRRLLEVHAGAERAPRPGHDADAHLVVGGEVVQRLGLLGAQIAAEGVEPLRAVHREDRVVVELFVQQVWHRTPPCAVVALPRDCTRCGRRSRDRGCARLETAGYHRRATVSKSAEERWSSSRGGSR